MTEQTMWRILDAWREDKRRVAAKVRNRMAMGNSYRITRYPTLRKLLTKLHQQHTRQFNVRWFIDGVEVVDETIV